MYLHKLDLLTPPFTVEGSLRRVEFYAMRKKAKRKTKIQKIAVCASASFYKEALELEKKLKKSGFKVALPCTAYTMRKTGNYDVEFYKRWMREPAAYKRKTYLMRNHFRKIIESDALLIVNLEKNGVTGYIGGNVLMEMAIGFHHRKPIFILHKVASSSPFYEEILGMSPIFIEGDLTKII